MRVGACRDRLADAFERFGRVPVVRRTRRVPVDDAALRGRDAGPTWSAGGLVHDGEGRILLLQHSPPSPWGGAWVTPGGRLEEGETVLEGLVREVREETDLELRDPVLTRIVNETLTDGTREVHGYFAQFIARAASTEAKAGAGIRDVRWFSELPRDLAFREDYVEDFGRLRAATF